MAFKALRWVKLMHDFSDNFKSMQGEVIVLASGPSAADFPLDDFREIPVIAMNGSILKCIENNIKPLFYICDDLSFIEGRSALASLGVSEAYNVAMSKVCYQAIDSCSPGLLDGKNLFLLERVNREGVTPRVSDRRFAWSIRKDNELISGFSFLFKKPNRIGFSRNLSRGYFGSRTIAYAGVQLACHLGFNRVFMVGVDLSHDAGRFYEQGKEAMPTALGQAYNDYILPSFEIMAKRVVHPGIFEVYNLSDSSRLPEAIVPKISIFQFGKLLSGCV